MKIIEDAPAPNPRRVRIFLAEKGIEIAFEQVAMMDREHLTAAFGKLNPWHRVPVLVLDDGTAISETMAICRYFEAASPEPRLFGGTPLEQATIEMWNRRAELHLLFHIAQHFRHLHPKMAHLEVPQVPAWGEANRDKALETLALFDEQLSRNTFVAGDAFSVADITAAIAVNFMKPARIALPDNLGHVRRWFDEIRGRESWNA